MKTLLLFFAFTCTQFSWSQNDTIVHLHKFPNGKTSTIIFIKEFQEGYAKAFNFKGEEIYHNHVRRFAGHATVTFKHHPNGMVKEAHYSSHPDAGIQWYKSWTTFDDQGNKLREEHQNWNDRVTVPHHRIPDSLLFRQTPPPRVIPDVQPEVKPDPHKTPDLDPVHQPNPILKPTEIKKEVVGCAEIHQNHTRFINHSRRKILLNINHQGKDTLVILRPRKSFEGPTYISAQIKSPMNHNVRFSYNCTRKNCKIDSVLEIREIDRLETQHRVHFYARRKEK